MTTRRVQLAILLLLTILLGPRGAQSQTKPQQTKPEPTQTPMIGGLGGSQSPGLPPVTGASLLPTDPVAEFQAFVPQLNLAPDQQGRIKAIAAGRQPVLNSADRMLSDAATAFHHAADSGNESAIRAGAARIGQYLGELQALRVRTAADMRAVLTPPQAARLQQLKAQAAQRQKEMAGSLQRLQEQMQQAQSPVPAPQAAPGNPKP